MDLSCKSVVVVIQNGLLIGRLRWSIMIEKETARLACPVLSCLVASLLHA